MTKIVLVCLLAILPSSCISFYDTNLRDSDRCVYSIVNPETGTLRETVEANEENFMVNKPDCDRIFDNLDL